MSNSPHDSRRSPRLSLFSNRVIQRSSCSCLLILASSVTDLSQADDTSSSAVTSGAPQSTSEGIQKHWNEFGVWGGISFDAPTLIGKTPDARFGNIGLRYGRVRLASKTVAFEWTNRRYSGFSSFEQSIYVCAKRYRLHRHSGSQERLRLGRRAARLEVQLPPQSARATIRPGRRRLPLLQQTDAGDGRCALQLHS